MMDQVPRQDHPGKVAGRGALADRAYERLACGLFTKGVGWYAELRDEISGTEVRIPSSSWMLKTNLDRCLVLVLPPRLAIRYADTGFAEGRPHRWCIQARELAGLGEGLAPAVEWASA